MKTNQRNLHLELIPRRAAIPAPSTLRMWHLSKLATSSMEAREMLKFINSMAKLKANPTAHKFYSSFSSGNGKGGNIIDSFNNNELMIWLPSIIFDGSRDNTMNKTTDHDFHFTLKGILDELSLDKSSLYKLEYSLFLHTNDKSKGVVYYLAPDSGIESAMYDMDEVEWGKAMVVLHWLFIHFKFHGYSVIRSDLIDFDKVKDYDLYTSEVHKSLTDSIPSVNKNPKVGFIEFRKSALLKITKNSKY